MHMCCTSVPAREPLAISCRLLHPMIEAYFLNELFLIACTTLCQHQHQLPAKMAILATQAAGANPQHAIPCLSLSFQNSLKHISGSPRAPLDDDDDITIISTIIRGP